jgi:hypothetical protein
MELTLNAHVLDGLPASMTLLNEKPCHGVTSWESATQSGINEANSTAAIGLRFRGWEIASGTVVAPNNLPSVATPSNGVCTAAGAAAGASAGALIGEGLGALAGGGVGTLVAPGVGTIGGGALGATGGATVGATIGGVLGGIIGNVNDSTGGRASLG